MDGAERGGGGRWKTLRERLGFSGIGGCCGGGAIWGFGASTNMRLREEEEEEEEHERDLQEEIMDIVGQIPSENSLDQACVGQIPVAASGINLAMALAAERHFRAAQDWDNGGTTTTAAATSLGGRTGTAAAATNHGTTMTTATAAAAGSGTPLRVSLMRLLEDGDIAEEEEEEEEETETEKSRGGGRGSLGSNDVVCCVCMERKKGAAFIPCGHTYCRVCSRELWLNRGTCPLCNRSILEILDIF